MFLARAESFDLSSAFLSIVVIITLLLVVEVFMIAVFDVVDFDVEVTPTPFLPIKIMDVDVVWTMAFVLFGMVFFVVTGT